MTDIHVSVVDPSPREIFSACHGSPADRIRVIRCAGVTIHVQSVATLDALASALDEIRADMTEEPKP